MAVPNASISELFSLTVQQISGDINDNVSNLVPFFMGLKDGKRTRKQNGGPAIQVTLEYAENQTTDWIDGGEQVDIRPSTTHTGATAQWKIMTMAVSLLYKEIRQNSGPGQVFDLIDARLKNSQHTYKNQLEAAFQGDGTSYGGKILTGLQALIAATPTNTVQGIDRSQTVAAFWKNQVLKAVTDGFGAMSSTNIKALFNRAFQLSQRYDGSPNAIFASDNPFRFFEDSLQNIVRVTDTNNKYAKMGFQAYMHKNAPVVYQPTTTGIPTDYVYVIDFDGLEYVVDSETNFVPMNPTRHSINQLMEVRLMALMANLVLLNARKQVLITNT